MPSIRQPPRHTVIAAVDARRLTGLEPDQLLAERDVQQFTRINADGTRQTMLRVPTEHLLDQASSAAGT